MSRPLLPISLLLVVRGLPTGLGPAPCALATNSKLLNRRTGNDPELPAFVPPWNHSFEDPRIDTELLVPTDSRTFQFPAPNSYDSGVISDPDMRVTEIRIIISQQILEERDYFRSVCWFEVDSSFGFGNANRRVYRIHEPSREEESDNGGTPDYVDAPLFITPVRKTRTLMVQGIPSRLVVVA